MKVRRTNDNCLTCGGQKPTDAVCERDGYHATIKCPKCDWIIARGLIRTPDDGRPHGVDSPSHMGEREPALPLGTDFHLWEKWWTRDYIVSAINGRPVAGEEKLYELISDIEDLYDCSR